jgi:hypothetical protein
MASRLGRLLKKSAPVFTYFQWRTFHLDVQSPFRTSELWLNCCLQVNALIEQRWFINPAKRPSRRLRIATENATYRYQRFTSLTETVLAVAIQGIAGTRDNAQEHLTHQWLPGRNRR